MSEVTRPMRFDFSVSFDLGSTRASFDRDVVGSLTTYFTLISPELGGPDGNPAHLRLGGRLGISAYGRGGQEFIDLTPEEEQLKKCRYPQDVTVYGVRIFAGPELDVPMSDIVSLRFSPGAVLRYDDSIGFKAGAGLTSALVVDLGRMATFMVHFSSDLYMQDDTEQFMFGIGFGLGI